VIPQLEPLARDFKELASVVGLEPADIMKAAGKQSRLRLAGGAGAAVLAVFGSSLMHDYTDAAATEQVVIAAQFATLMAVVMRSIWQFLDGILIGVWWLGIGLLLRPDRPRLSRLTLVLAAVAVVGAFVNLVGLSLVRDVLLGVLFILWAAWWISLLVVFARQTQTSSTTSPS
jgi:hypothetical protein